ncbi:DUF4360 domain-containing protein [Streptacidiphilus neutrinimicus]|uniref:DUF4360 domain-containing protein n=1 Tax=Streptacidiphilus neutrinimicus TaxID=105420 RepID=UPI0005A9653B|nr:DUF4360 domain-containing protein [Streptacidiphilus neutrinimicus]
MIRSIGKAAVATALLATSLAATGSVAHASGRDVPPPGGFTIGLVNANGSGCPSGTTAATVSPDATAFTVTYSNYLAQAGGNSLPTDFRKNCQLVVQINAPQGFTYAIAEADYRGYAYLAPGASGIEAANYYFQGQAQTGTLSHAFNGAMSDDWQATDTASVASLVWAPCGETRDLNINTQLLVRAGSQSPGQTSFMTMDSTDGSLTTIYHLAWEQCPRR